MKLSIRDQTCHLLAEKAVFWQEEQALIVADMHMGKSTLFRKAGIPIPEGMMADDLKALASLIEHWQVKKCIILGDLIHAKAGLSHNVIQQFSEWLHKLPCEVHLILGNHDAALFKKIPESWPLNVHKDGLVSEPFYFSHFPQHQKDCFVWAGHVHPKVEIKNNYDRLVLRCFQIFPDLAIMPAFGFFVGGALVKKSADSKIYAIADDLVIEL